MCCYLYIINFKNQTEHFLTLMKNMSCNLYFHSSLSYKELKPWLSKYFFQQEYNLTLLLSNNQEKLSQKQNFRHLVILNNYLCKQIIQFITKMQILSSSKRLTNKQNGVASPSKQLLKMKVQLNDRIFEYHKLEEDYAQEKAKVMMQFQKERKTLIRAIKQLKEKNIVDNQEWVKKIDEIRKDRDQSLAFLTYFFQQQIQQKTVIIRKDAEVQFQKELQKLKKEIQRLKCQNSINQNQFYQQKQFLVKNFTLSLKKKQDEKDNHYKVIIEGLQKQTQKSLLQLQLLYLKEQKRSKKLQYQGQQKNKAHEKEKSILEATNRQISMQNQQLLQSIAILQQSLNIEKKNNNLHLEKQEQQKNKYAVMIENQVIRVTQEYQFKLKERLQIYCQQIHKLQVEITKLETIYKQKQLLWQQRGKKVIQLYQRRESKKEDLQAIQTLEVQLIKRDVLIEREKRQVKNCKLQLENMQDIYDRMFISTSNVPKIKSKSFKVKKLKNSSLMSSCNRSTIIQVRKPKIEDN